MCGECQELISIKFILFFSCFNLRRQTDIQIGADGIEVVEDINEALKDADDPEAALKSWQESGHMADLRQAVRRAKATQWLMDTANVTEVEED